MSEAVAIECHDFVADQTGDERMRTKATVIEVLNEAGFEVRLRDDPRDFVAGMVYGTRSEGPSG